MIDWVPEVVGAVWGAVTNRFRGGGAKWLPLPSWTKRWANAATMAVPVAFVNPWWGLAVLGLTYLANSLATGPYLGAKNFKEIVLASLAGLVFVASAAAFWAFQDAWWSVAVLAFAGLLKGPAWAFDVYVLPPRKTHKYLWREVIFGAISGGASGYTWS